MKTPASTLAGFASILISLAFASTAHALPGDLDTSFSGDGIVTTFFGDFNFARATASAVAIQTNGLIVVGGAAFNDSTSSPNGRFALARYTASGGLDTGFGSGGLVTTDITTADEAVNGLALQADGKIVAVGDAGDDFALVRYNPNGTRDTGFGNNGIATGTLSSDSEDTLRAIAIQPDGKIIVGGRSDGDFILMRFHSNGALDTGFGTGGEVTTDFGGSGDVVNGIVLQSDGKIVAAGSALTVTRFEEPPCEEVSGRLSVARYHPDGSLDGSFGTGGLVTTRTRKDSAHGHGVALQSNGRILLSGVVANHTGCFDRVLNRPTFDFLLARYDGNGALDGSFGNGGLVETDFGGETVSGMEGDESTAVAIQPDGNIVSVGFTHRRFALARYDTNGNLDPTFGAGGRQTTALDGDAFANAVAIQRSDGRIVLAGSQDFGTSATVFALARYHAFSCGGKNVTALGTNGPDILNGRTLFNPLTGKTTSLADVIQGLGGGDTIDGGGNSDNLCGGSGGDTIRGGSGDDVLLGETGSDALDGGDGNDTCSGGGFAIPADSFQNCETVSTGKSGFSGEWLDVVQTCNRSEENPKCRLKGTVEVVNPGSESTAIPVVAAFYLSSDDQLDEADRFLANLDIPVLQAGEETILRFNFKIPGGEDLSGSRVIVVLDAHDEVAEVNEANNVVASPPIE